MTGWGLSTGGGNLDKSREDQRRLYGDLAWTWPIVSPPEDYIPEGEYFAGLIRENSDFEVKTLLHLGCGGGHNDFTLKRHFDMTGVDISETMLGLARKLNPDVTYLPGDMRSVRLESTFDSVAILDAVNYMLTRDDLRRAFETAFHHLRPGGVFLTTVEQTPEGFRQNLTRQWTKRRDDTEITFIENSYDPDPEDSTYESTFVFLIRQSGKLDIEIDRHLGGMFPMDTWHEILRDVGFTVKQTFYEDPSEDGERIPVLLCTKPG
ncbi:class I SAM-dependent methyltransferase [Candidatus Eisenbacteria bacterium]|uniref:Class I SAM-dependent methyltransferase n=1 Tax=Eiseniibacteriota bacterium TaxID=2212470 RepID=A0ABV6YPZ5_UNCEI